jgi:AraC family transcriptional regulator of arabinose operon
MAKLDSFNVAFAAGRTVMDPSSIYAIYRPHGMDGWIANYTVSGRGRINRDDKLFYVEQGDVLLFKTGVPHDYTADEQAGGWVHLWAYFFPRATWQSWIAWPRAPGGVLKISIADLTLRERIVQSLERVIQLYNMPLRRRVDFCMNGLEEFFLWCDAGNPKGNEAQLDARIQKALFFMCENASERLTLGRISKACGLSHSRLSHLFAEQVGVTPMAYLENYRLERARELLLLTGKSVAEVAYDVGFANPAYFGRVFRRRFRLAPRAYREGARTERLGR